MVSWAILELIPRIECFVSSDFVNSAMSAASTIGDAAKFVTHIVAALPIFESFNASTISFEEPECDMPIATLCLSKCEAIIA